MVPKVVNDIRQGKTVFVEGNTLTAFKTLSVVSRIQINLYKLAAPQMFQYPTESGAIDKIMFLPVALASPR
jgi:hypothetical protein